MGALEVKNIVSGYAGKTVVKDISFDAAEGEFIGIIGPNGAGKSTLMRTISRVLRPESGSISIGSRDIFSMPQKEFARSVAFVSSDPAVVFPFTALEVVMMGRFPYIKMFGSESKEDMEAVERAVEATDCAGVISRPIDRLSAGERQRVLIAKALAQEPRLMLLDEPTSHLDISHQVQVLDILKGLSGRKITVIAVLHDLNLAAEYCDRLVLIDKGLVRSSGTPKQVLDYNVIEEVYRTVVVVRENPVSGKPYVLLAPGSKKGEDKQGSGKK
ncbi:MAG: ABC transporter ATP-binding protein [Candidatus Omnitrophota bacterium]